MDHCFDPISGELLPWASPIIDAAIRENAYIERSPSRTGFHIIGRGRQLESGRKKNDAEMYSSGRYFTITGNLVSSPSGPLGTLTETAALVLARIGAKAEKPDPIKSTPGNEHIGSLDTDDAIVARARTARNATKFCALFDQGDINGYPSQSEAEAALALILCFWTRKDAPAVERIMRRSALMRSKWDTPRGDSTYLKDTIAHAIAQCSDMYGAPTTAMNDYYAYLPMHQYIFEPSRDLWPAASVNARVLPVWVDGRFVSANKWLDANRAVHQMTWAPGEPLIVRDRLISAGGWITHQGGTVFNQYRPPQLTIGNPANAGRWIDLVNYVFPDAAEHIIKYLAHRIQKPGEKINHALLMGGDQGIGKDSILEPIKEGIGPWNFEEVTPTQLLGRFNGFIKCIILRISEARDLGEFDRCAFYEHTKIYIAAPPNVLRCDEKNVREYSVFNVMGVVITTNNKSNGLYLPADDRRHFVAWSDRTKADYAPNLWNEFYSWLAAGGTADVVAYLAGIDLTAFDAKAPPPKTAAFYDIADANRAPESSELADALDKLRNPRAVTLKQIEVAAGTGEDGFYMWLTDRKNRRQIPHRMESAGYVPVRNPDAPADGLWKIKGRRRAVYARRELSPRDRLAAATALTRAPLTEQTSFVTGGHEM